MLDVPNNIERGLVHDTIHRGGTHKSVYTYVHDKWQIRPDVTLDLGLRHELYFPLVGYTPEGGQATYDPDTNTIRVGGYGDIPQNLGVHTSGRTSTRARESHGASPIPTCSAPATE